MKKSKFMKTSDAAKYLGVSHSSITNWVRSGELEGASTPGGHYLFSKRQLDEFAASRGMDLVDTRFTKASYKILVIDDDQGFRTFIEEALDIYVGYELKHAEDGMQGAFLVGTWKPDLVIVDLRMPNMNGVDFCKYIKSNNDLADVSVIVASAYLSHEVREEISSIGVDYILEKPVRLAVLVSTITKLIDLQEK